MLDVSAVQIEAQAPQRWVQVAVDSCEAALGRGRCFTEAPPSSAEQPWQANVSDTTADSLTWRIEFSDPGDPTSLRSREIHFIEADGQRERWMTAGVVVAAMVVAEQAVDQRKAPQFPSEVLNILRRQADQQQPMAEAPPAVEAPGSARELLVTAGGAAGWYFESKQLQWGPVLSLQQRFALPIVIGTQLGYLRGDSKSSDFELYSVTAGAGLASRPESLPLSAQISAQFVLQRAFVTAHDPSSSASQTQAVTRLGGGVDVMGAWHFSEVLALAAGLQANLVRPELSIRVGEEQPDSLGGASGLLYLSLMALSN